MSELKISFIIVNWNAKDVLVGCIDSINQDVEGSDFEIIVVDNASEDGSQEFIKQNYPDIILIENRTNLGFSKANNIGVERSRGDLLFLVNSDIVVLQGCICEMASFMDRNGVVGMAGPRILNRDMTLQTSCSNYPNLWNLLSEALFLNRIFPGSQLFSGWRMSYWNHDRERQVDVLSGCFWVIRREALQEVGNLDERYFIYGEDIDWSRRFNSSRWEVRFNPRAQAIHLGGASSANSPVRFYLEMQKANLIYWRKFHNSVEVLGFKVVTILHHLIRITARICIALLRFKPGELKNNPKLQKSLAILKYFPLA